MGLVQIHVNTGLFVEWPWDQFLTSQTCTERR